MAMTVRYNASANRALNQTNKNDKARSKALGKVASGMKINSAQDDAASFSISARMRVKLRALEQDTQNVQNGSSILNTAEGGIQRQIDIIRTIREKVIDAANDHNTDEDRQTIQKELVHLYDEMDSIAYGTDFNSKKPLLCNSKIKIIDADSSDISGTKLNLIRDAEFDTLDGIRGPFAAFTEYSSTEVTLEKTSDGSQGSSKTMSMDFSGYTNVSQLNNVGIKVNGTNYVLTNDTSKNYRDAYPISINGYTSVSDVMNRLKNYFGGEIDGTKLKIYAGSIEGISDAGGSTPPTPTRVPNRGTGAGISGTTSGGYSRPINDPDLPEPSKATLTVNLSNVTSNTGFTFNNKNFRVLNAGASGMGTVDFTLTKGQSSRGDTGSFEYKFDGTNLTFTAKYDGDYKYSIANGYTYYTEEIRTTTYTAYSAFSGTIATVSSGTSTTYPTYSLDLSGMSVDDFSAQYAGKILSYRGYTKLYDSARAPKVEGLLEDNGSRKYYTNQRDIELIRQDVRNGSSLAQAVASRLGGTADGDKVKFNSYSQPTIITETLRHYDIDFSDLEVNIPSGLYGKGFRAYCATDDHEWFNFVFTDGSSSYESEMDNIKPININVSGVTNTTELLQAIYNQANEVLTGNDPKFNHHMRIAADYSKNIITLYDHRRFDVSQPPYDYQEKGAKIADGSSFKVIHVNNLVIQHTDKANMNIHVQIPEMTLERVFEPLPDANKTIFDYPVTDKKSRDALLGSPNPPGILDNGLKYLLDAVTLVGAQNKRLEFTAENITTEMENVTASESTIRDADMAKEMTEYTKYNILAQSSQAMLAQANQNQSMVLSLLQ